MTREAAVPLRLIAGTPSPNPQGLVLFGKRKRKVSVLYGLPKDKEENVSFLP